MSWINDWRGKPCQWVEEFVVEPEHVDYVSVDDWRSTGDHYVRAREAMERLQAAMAAIHADTANCYVVRTEPECVQLVVDKVHKIVVRARVHWCENEAEAMKFVEFEEQWMAPI